MPERLSKNSPITLVEPTPTSGGRLDAPLMPDTYTGINLPTRAVELLKEILSEKGYTQVVALNPRYNEVPGTLTASDWQQITNSPVLGISFITRTATQAEEMARRYKAVRPDGLVIAGGAHATFSVEECLGWADIVARHEGDETLPELLNVVIENGHYKGVKGISYKDKGMIINEPDRPFLTERQMEELPWPDFDPRFRKGVSASTVSAARGCPFGCDFCSESKMHGGCYRRMGNEFILPRVQEIYSAYPNDKIFFSDDNFAGLPKKAEDLFELWIDKGLTAKRFMLQLHASIGLRKGFPDLARKAGVFLEAMGIESSSDESLAALGKDSSSAKLNIEGVRATREGGVPVLGMFINGVDGDSKDRLREQLEWAKANVDLAQFYAPVPLPGTPFAQRMDDQERIMTRDYFLYDGQNVIIRSKDISGFDLQMFLHEMNEEFFAHALRKDTPKFGREVDTLVRAYARNGLRNSRRFFNDPQTQRHLEFLRTQS